MAAVYIGPEVPTVGTTPQTLASVGAGETAEIWAVYGWNRDTVAHVVTLTKTGGTIDPFPFEPITLQPGEKRNILPTPGVALDTSGEALKIESDATASTTEPAFHAAGLKVS